MLDVQSETAEQAESHLGHQRGGPSLLRLFSRVHSLSVSGWKRVARRQETPVKVQLSLGHPSLKSFPDSEGLMWDSGRRGRRFRFIWGSHVLPIPVGQFGRIPRCSTTDASRTAHRGSSICPWITILISSTQGSRSSLDFFRRRARAWFSRMSSGSPPSDESALRSSAADLGFFELLFVGCGHAHQLQGVLFQRGLVQHWPTSRRASWAGC